MSKPLDRLTLLETFVRISERGSISAAARDLGLSQASASRQLKELEDRLGVQLVRRTTHALAVTLAGQELLKDARGLLAEWSVLEERHGGGGDIAKGPLKIVAPVALGQRHLVDLALDFQLRHPQVSLSWQLQDEPIRFAEIGCDCWIKIGPVPDETLVVRPLGRVARSLVASPLLAGRDGLAGPADAEALPFVALEPFEGGRIALTDEGGAVHELRPPVQFATNNIFALHRAALKGAGAVVLPRWFIAEDLAAGRLIDLLPQWRAASYAVNVAYLPARHQPKRLSLFLQALTKGLGEIAGLEVPAADSDDAPTRRKA